MKSVVIIITSLMSLSLWAKDLKDESCLKKGIEINGEYGKYNSPLLKLWSESSGNFTGIQVKSKDKITKSTFIFKDEEKKEIQTKSFLFKKNNQSDKFDFNKMITESVIRPNTLTIELYTNSGRLCSEDMAVVERDGQGGVYKKL